MGLISPSPVHSGGRHARGGRGTGDELRSSPFGGAIPRTRLLREKIGRQVKVGSRFEYIFDLGDEWTHACTVEGHVDPLKVLGDIPDQPTAYQGWGMIPDQYWRQSDSQDGAPQPFPSGPLEEDRLGQFERRPAPLIDLDKLRQAVVSGRAGHVVEAVSAVEIGTALQQVGAGLLATYRATKGAEQASLSPVLGSVLQRLQQRDWIGDDILAAEILAEIRGEEPKGRPLPIDLDELTSSISVDAEYPDGYLNTRTGEVIPAVLTDASMVGEEDAVDVEDGDWAYLVQDGQEEWQDMADFAATVEDARIRGMLEDAVHGKGAFSRFRRAVDRADLWAAWHCFVDDRRWGRARQELADLGIRPA